jgi:hypothetical protein
MENLHDIFQKNFNSKLSSTFKKKNYPASILITLLFLIVSPLGTLPLLGIALIVTYRRLRYLQVLRVQLVKNRVL